jgi:RNA polymerase sigma-70 factor, ECF subfamily
MSVALSSIAMNSFATLLVEPAGLFGPRYLGLQESTQQYTRELESFLAGVEAKAFRIAQIALRHEDDALDAVQDAMLRLVRSYSARPPEQWRPLFYRILENCVRDMQRRRSVRGRVFTWYQRTFGEEGADAASDPLEQVSDPAPIPSQQAQTDQTLQALDAALAQLPARQRQAFLLRNLEGLDVAATASAMGCSEGSVKTHYFRALQALRAQLGEYWS